jgi:hypothetical protein
MIVEEFGQLLAQAFIPLAFVAEHNGPFEQGLLKLLRQIAPKVRGRRAKDEEVPLGVPVPPPTSSDVPLMTKPDLRASRYWICSSAVDDHR